MAREQSVRSLREHVTRSYISLRLGVVFIGAALPPALFLIGWLADNHGLLGSMSAYYYSPTARDVFVGALLAVGAILYLYKGFSVAEDRALNVAGVCVAGVAWVPTSPPGIEGGFLSWHGAFAIAFFLCIAYVCIARASDTLSLIRDTERARALRRTYSTLGGLMIMAPFAAAVLGFALRDRDDNSPLIFLVEAAGVWVFATYWFIKSRELEETGAAQLAMDGKLKATAVTSRPGRWIQVEP